MAYGQLSVDTGGLIGSVCAQDYSNQLASIGEVISKSKLSFPLGCIPVIGTPKSLASLPNLEPVTEGFSFSGDKIEVTSGVAPGSYRVTFSCFQ